MAKFKFPSITSPLAPDVRRFLDRIREAFGGTDGIVSETDLIESGAFTRNSSGRLTYAGSTGACAYPPAPYTLVATGAMTSVILTWAGTNYKDHAYTEIWRADTNDIGLAVLLGTANGSIYGDAVGSDSSRFYWVRFINTCGDAGPYQGVSGVAGTTSPDPAYLLDQLTGELTESQLTTALSSRIDLIDGPTTLAGSVAQQVYDEEQARIAAVTAEANTRSAAITAEANARTSADNALSSSISALTTTVNGNSAAISNVQVAYAAADSALAADITTLQSDVANNSAAIVTEAGTRASADSALSSSISTLSTTVGDNTTSISVNATSINGLNGKYTVKVDNNGYVSGFGLASTANNGVPTSEFTIVADKFSIAPVSTDNTLADGSPFFHRTVATTINGVSVPAGTYMKSAFIHDASISTAKIQNAAIDSAKIGSLAVTEAHIGTAAVSTAKIVDGAITNAKITNAAISTAKIAAAAVGNAQIANLAVDNAKIASLDAAKINTGYLNAARIQANTITSDKINVTSLSALSANIGTTTAGKIQNSTGSNYVNLNATGTSTFLQVGSGVTIRADGYAIFNNVVLSRQLLVDSGSFYPASTLIYNDSYGSTPIASSYVGQVQTNTSISSWAGSNKTYLCNCGVAGDVYATSGWESKVGWGATAEMFPMTFWYGPHRIWLKLYFVHTTVQKVVNMRIDWKIYEVT